MEHGSRVDAVPVRSESGAVTTYEYRRQTEDDVEAHRRLGRQAFGRPATASADTPAPPPRPGATRWGAFLGDELVGRVEGFALGSWFGGRVLPTVGIGGVVVAPEHRGRGVSRGLVTQVLDHHRAQGAALSTLYPTAPGYYRGLGYEVVGSYDEVVVPSAALATMAPGPPGRRTRRATTAAGPALRSVYDAWAAAQNGPLDRRGPAFAVADDDWVADHEAVTVVEDEQGAVRGFASWDRGTGYGAAAHLSVAEVLAVDADSYRALWHVIGSFAAVVGEVRLLTSGADVARYALHAKDWKVTVEDVYMLRVEDGADRAHRDPPPLRGLGAVRRHRPARRHRRLLPAVHGRRQDGLPAQRRRCRRRAHGARAGAVPRRDAVVRQPPQRRPALGPPHLGPPARPRTGWPPGPRPRLLLTGSPVLPGRP